MSPAVPHAHAGVDSSLMSFIVTMLARHITALSGGVLPRPVRAELRYNFRSRMRIAVGVPLISRGPHTQAGFHAVLLGEVRGLSGLEACPHWQKGFSVQRGPLSNTPGARHSDVPGS